jgi:NitT/TauT family transport system permease protein
MSLLQVIMALMFDTSVSWLRMFVALAASIVISLFLGIYAAISPRVERLILPVVDILQTLPILAFFPFAIYIVLLVLPGYIGVNAAVIFLIITSMVWNVIFGVYESIKNMPHEFEEVAELYHLGRLGKLRRVYIPAAMPTVVEQSVLSWSIGLFYLVTSEIFSIGSSAYSVKYGIGVALTSLATTGNLSYYALGLAIFVLFVVVTRFAFFAPLERHFNSEKGRNTKPFKLKGGYLSRMRLSGEMTRIRHSMWHGRAHRKVYKSAKGLPSPVAGPEKGAGQKSPDMHTLAGLIVIVLFLLIVYVVYPSLFGYETLVLESLAASFARVWLTFLIVLVIAVPLSVYLVFISKHTNGFLYLFQILASIPATILLPLIALSLSGTPMHGDITAFIVFFISGIWYVIFSSIASSKSLGIEIGEVKRLFQVKGLRAWKSIYVKALLPGIVTGSVTGIAAEWNASIVAEYFTNTGISGTNVISSVGIGIGKLLDTSLASGNLLLMVIALINLTVMILLINKFVWRNLYKRISAAYK